MKLARSTYYDEPELQPLGEAPISRIALVSAFLTGGLRSFLIFRAPSRSRRSTGFDLVVGCGVELGGSLLVILGLCVWLGAGGLGVLTAVAMFAANDF